MASFCCSSKFFLLLLILSAVPIAILVSLELSHPATHVYQYYGAGWMRECSKWDDVNRRFIVSFMDGGLGVIPVPDDSISSANPTLVEEIPVVKLVDLAGNGSVGLTIDRPRNRVLVTIADVFGNSYSAVAAYDWNTWDRLFLTQLSRPGEGKNFADDVAVDAEGNAYITDAQGNKIWKVGVNGDFLSVIESPLFPAKEWYKNFVNLNGIAYHPNGYLLVSHTLNGNLFKIDIKNDNEVKQVKVDSLAMADGIELLSPTKLVVAGAYGAKLVESTDGWETASIIGRSSVLKHRLATATTVKDGKVYINHALGIGYPKKKHLLVEAVFS